MKEPVEYLGNVNAFTTREELYNIGKQIQNDAYNEAINTASKEVLLSIDDNCEKSNGQFYISCERDHWIDTKIEIDKNSILKLLKS